MSRFFTRGDSGERVVTQIVRAPVLVGVSPVAPPYQPESILPGAGWTGTAGSGFASAPADPTRTTAKPACRLLQPPNQWFTDTLTIGVWAGANDGGSLLNNLGLEKVRVYWESDTPHDILFPTVRSFAGVDGVTRSYLGWWITLKKPAGASGHGNVYFEAVPRDATMQRRVIGPYQFSPQPALYSPDVTIEPSQSVITGSRYQTWQAALAYVEAQNPGNARITFKEAMNLDLSTSGTSYAGGAGYIYVEATAPVTFKKASFSTSGTARLFRTGVDGLWFRGPNITFDFKDVAYIYHENIANRPHVFEGVNFIKSDGANATFMLSTSDTTFIARNRPWFLECTVDSISLPFAGADTVRGCSGGNGVDDLFSTVYCCVGNTFHTWGSGNWRTPINALTVQYSGSGTGTIEISGANNTARTVTAKVAGASVGTFSIQVGEAAFIANTNYTVANVAAWINSLSGWSATALNNTRRAATLSLPGTTSFGAFGATNAKTAPLTLITAFDLHTDMWRLFTGTQENIVCADNVFYNVGGQGFFVNSNGGTGLRDVMIVNNSLEMNQADPDTVNSFTQLSDIQSHVVYAHNSQTQQVNLRKDGSYNPDAYCLVANNVAPAIVWAGTGSPTDADLVIKGNHLFTGATAPAGATGTTIGGNEASLFVDAGSGDFTPQGALLTNLKTPLLARDRSGVARGASAPAGALAG